MLLPRQTIVRGCLFLNSLFRFLDLWSLHQQRTIMTAASPCKFGTRYLASSKFVLVYYYGCSRACEFLRSTCQSLKPPKKSLLKIWLGLHWLYRSLEDNAKSVISYSLIAWCFLSFISFISFNNILWFHFSVEIYSLVGKCILNTFYVLGAIINGLISFTLSVYNILTGFYVAYQVSLLNSFINLCALLTFLYTQPLIWVQCWIKLVM